MAGALGFLAEGVREIARKVKRAGARRQMAAQGRERDAALAGLGKAAWDAKLDLGGFPDLREKLAQLDARASELAGTAKRLDAERADLTARRKAAVERFDGLARAAQAEKTKADGALAAARTVLAGKDRAIGAAEARLTRIAAELARPAAEPGSPAPAS